MTPNEDGLHQCPICGTSSMMRQYRVRFVLEVDITDFSEIEAMERAIAAANGDLLNYIVDTKVIVENEEQ